MCKNPCRGLCLALPPLYPLSAQPCACGRVFAVSVTGNIWDRAPGEQKSFAKCEFTSLLCNYFHATQAMGGEFILLPIRVSFPDTSVPKMPARGCNGQNSLIKNKSLMTCPALPARGGVSSRLAPPNVPLALLRAGSTGEGWGTGLAARNGPVRAHGPCTLLLPPRIPAPPPPPPSRPDTRSGVAIKAPIV